MFAVLAVAAVPALSPPSHAAGGEDPAFMPKGGRALLLDLMPQPKAEAELRQITQQKRTEQEWRAYVDDRGKSLTEKERVTLAAYLAVNLPLAGEPKQPGAESLPADGRDLAWNECQSCHSLFSGYLTQNRDAQAWRNVFLSPFHKQMKVSPQAREEFARYSAINMPLKVDDVPQELRY
jgi:hypothetical protein